MKKKSEENPQEEKTKPKKKSDPEKLREKTEALQKEKDELFAKLQRVSADYANFQKRSVKQAGETIAYEKEKVIKTMLPALDNFEHMLDKGHSAESVDVLVNGVQIIYDQMLDILQSHNVEQIKAVGEKFDPAVHQAMMRRSEPEMEDGIVLEEFQKGYKLNGRVIRPSKVIVNGIEASQEESDQQGQAEQ